MTTLAVTSVSSPLCQASTCLRIGSKLRCMRSTPTEMQSIRQNDFECLAKTGVNTAGTCFKLLVHIPSRRVLAPLNEERVENSTPVAGCRDGSLAYCGACPLGIWDSISCINLRAGLSQIPEIVLWKTNT